MSKHPSDMRPESRNNLFKQLGVLAQSVGWVRAGVPLGESISKMIRKLSNAEIASFENGAGIPHHVKAYAAKQAAEAKKVQQEADAARNDAQKNLTIPHGMDEAFGRGGVLRAHRGLPGSVRYGRQDIASSGSSGRNYASLSTQWDPSTGGVGLTRSNFFNTPFAGLGLDFNTTKFLFSQGFNTQQIKQAANDSKAIGLSPKQAAVDVAHLRKAEGKRTDQHLKSLSDYGRELEDLERKRLAEEAKPDSPQKLENLRQLDAQKKAIESKQDKYQRNNVITPEGKKRYNNLRQMKRDDAEQRAKIGAPGARAQDDTRLDKQNQEKGQEKIAENVKDSEFKIAGRVSDKNTSDDFLSTFGVSGATHQKAGLAVEADKPKIVDNHKGINKELAGKDDKPGTKKEGANHPTATAKLNKSGPAPA